MTLLTINPTASNHDAREDNAGAMTLTGAIALTSASYWGGLLLPAVALPVGATVDSATLYYFPTNTSSDDVNQNIYGEAADNAGVFTTTTSDISSRARTTAFVADIASSVGAAYRAVDVTAIVAEIGGRAGWASGNNMALILDCLSGSSTLVLRTWDNTTNVWYVEINYTAAGSGQAAAARGRQVPGMRRPHGQQGW